MNGKRAKELRAAARMLAPDEPGRVYTVQQRTNWRYPKRAPTLQVRVEGKRGIYRNLKRWYKAAKRRDGNVTRIMDRTGLRMHGA